MEETAWVSHNGRMINLTQVAGFEVDMVGKTQDHIGYIKFMYEGGNSTLEFGNMNVEENKTKMDEFISKIKNIINSGILGSWTSHNGIYINLDVVGSIILKEHGDGADNNGKILFQYIIKRTAFSFGDMKKEENKKAFNNKLNEIKSKINIK